MTDGYFVFEVEGEAPEGMDRAELEETLNASLPDWAAGYTTRFDG